MSFSNEISLPQRVFSLEKYSGYSQLSETDRAILAVLHEDYGDILPLYDPDGKIFGQFVVDMLREEYDIGVGMNKVNRFVDWVRDSIIEPLESEDLRVVRGFQTVHDWAIQNTPFFESNKIALFYLGSGIFGDPRNMDLVTRGVALDLEDDKRLLSFTLADTLDIRWQNVAVAHELGRVGEAEHYSYGITSLEKGLDFYDQLSNSGKDEDSCNALDILFTGLPDFSSIPELCIPLTGMCIYDPGGVHPEVRNEAIDVATANKYRALFTITNLAQIKYERLKRANPEFTYSLSSSSQVSHTGE